MGCTKYRWEGAARFKPRGDKGAYYLGQGVSQQAFTPYFFSFSCTEQDLQLKAEDTEIENGRSALRR